MRGRAAGNAGSGDGARPRAGDRGHPLRLVSGWDEAGRGAGDTGAAAGAARGGVVRRLHRRRFGMALAALNRGILPKGSGLGAASPVISRQGFEELSTVSLLSFRSRRGAVAIVAALLLTVSAASPVVSR